MKWHTAFGGSDLEGIKRGMYFAAAMVVVALGSKIVVASGGSATDAASWAQRGVMVLAGLYVTIVGNALPKTSLVNRPDGTRCDGPRSQRFMRVAGWTWALAGLIVTIAWATLPSRIADPVTFIVLPAAILIVAARSILF